MKILIIAMNIGRIAPGIVVERLIKGISEYHVVDILTRDYDPSINLDKVGEVLKFKYIELHPRFSEMLISIFAINPLDLYFSKKAISKCEKKYDLILSIISASHYVSLIMGNKLACKLKVRHVSHFLDAIPAPVGWLRNELFFRGLERFISQWLSKVDGLFATNEEMLNYQLTFFKPQKSIITEVIYTPGPGKLEKYKYPESKKNTFLFTGGLYGPRKPRYLLEAFRIILMEYPDSTLEFVGTTLPEHCLAIFEPKDKEKVILHSFTRRLEPYYERATALIDIDADFPDDIFLSSKIVNYISIDRTIITVTGDNSPSRKIFKGIPSILQCSHKVEEIAEAMRIAIRYEGKIDYNDRQNVISKFSLNSVTEKINNAISFEH